MKVGLALYRPMDSFDLFMKTKQEVNEPEREEKKTETVTERRDQEAYNSIGLRFFD